MVRRECGKIRVDKEQSVGGNGGSTIFSFVWSTCSLPKRTWNGVDTIWSPSSMQMMSMAPDSVDCVRDMAG